MEDAMKIAAIVICYNDDYKLNEWIDNYQYYRDSIYKLIIVDNGSRQEFIDLVKESFKDATLILHGKNKGLTVAYNEGIKRALADEEVDAIMLIANDIKITNESVNKMYNELSGDKAVGMVAPVLLNKDSDIVSDAGATISYCFYMKPKGSGLPYSEIDKKSVYVDSVTGGMNMAKREFYENVGLQDEALFMYSDEVDMGYRAREKGYKMLLVGGAVAWHQHINPAKREKRLPFSDYMMARNRVYLGNKFCGKGRAIIIFVHMVVKSICRCIINVLRRKDCEGPLYAIYGSWNGLIGKMEIPSKMKLYL